MSYAGPAARRSRLSVAGRTSDARSTGRGTVSGSTYPPKRHFTTPAANSDKLTVFASGIALGLLVGGGVALLFAPAEGKDVRRALARRGKRVRQRGSDAWDDLAYEFRRLARRRTHWREHRREQHAED
jgi:hypothetical protein